MTEKQFKQNFCCQFIDDNMTNYHRCGCIYKFDIKRNRWRLKYECKEHRNITLRMKYLRHQTNAI